MSQLHATMFEFFQTNFKNIVEMFVTEFDVNIDEDGQNVLNTYESEMGEKLSELLGKEIKKDNKKKKDPTAPKRGKSSYIFFCSSKRPEIKEEYPTEPTTGIIKKLGEAWRNLSDEEKVPFVKQAVADKKRYSRDMESYVPSESEDSSAELKVKKKTVKKESNVKRTPSGYQLFCVDMRVELKDQNPDASFGQIGHLLGDAWASDDKRKAEYNERASKLKAEYTKVEIINEPKKVKKTKAKK